MRTIYFLSILVSLLSLSIRTADTCTDFVIKAKDGTRVVGRSMEFAAPMNSLAIMHPRGEVFKSTAPGGKAGITWTGKYGFVGITSMGKAGFNDGMNEKGLSIGFLWMPGTKYQTIGDGENQNAIEILDFGPWLLSNFTTVDEIKGALSNIRVWGAVNPLLKSVPPLHVAVHDATGNNFVIEFLNGEMQLHDNPIGVLTNYPSFDWQLTNLGNYVNLTPFDAKPRDLEGTTIFPTGHGSGLHGLPGDMTPPSRFVRTVYFKQSALPASNTTEAINLAEHLLNAVDIPKGANVISKKSTEGDYTQWAVIKDLTHRVLYFRTYDNIALSSIDLNKLDLTPGSSTKPIPLNVSFQD